MEHPLGARIPPEEVSPHLSAWIDPEGRVYHVPECKHWLIAEKLGFTCSELEARGWMHLTYGSIYLEARQATQPQLDALFVIECHAVRRSTGRMLENWSATIQKFIGI